MKEKIKLLKEKFNSYTKEEQVKWINQMSRLYIYDPSLKEGEIESGIHINDIIK